MKVAFLFLVFLVAASADFVTTGTGTSGNSYDTLGSNYGTTTGTKAHIKTADKEFLLRNKNIVRLLTRVYAANNFEDQYNIGKEYNIATWTTDKYTNVGVVKDFFKLYKTGLLPKYAVFSVTNKRQFEEATALFYVFYFAKDYDTFYKSACWARDNVNEGMFVYALTTAVLHRADTRGMLLPPPYEVSPFYFVHSEAIQKTFRLKMQEGVRDNKIAESYGIHQEGNTFVIKTNYSGWYSPINEESSLSYFTEDVGLNTYFLYNHYAYPFWLSKNVDPTMSRNGEYTLYWVQQLLARYYLERLSTGLGEIPRFLWTKPIKTGYKSPHRHPNGFDFPSRPNDFYVNTEQNLWDFTTATDYERRIRDIVDSGHVFTEDGKVLSLKNPEDVNRLGSLIHSNADTPNKKYFQNTYVARKLLGNGGDIIDDHKAKPAVMEKHETTLNDPMFYQLMQRYVHSFQTFKSYLPPYTRDEVSFPGVKIEDVTVDKLVTYYDFFDVDITSATARTTEEVKANKDEFTFVSRQPRLNHLPFNVKLDISSEKTTDAVVRIFLGPKYNGQNQFININDNRVNFFELDQFFYTVKTGKNTINRNSRDFALTTGDYPTTRDLYRKFTASINGNEEFVYDTAGSRKTLFPDRLVLPRGTRNGLQFYFYVVITPVRNTKTYTNPITDTTNTWTTTTTTNPNSNINFFTPTRFVDDNAFGYPLDRTIDTPTFFNTNMFLKDVTIYHKTGVSTTTTTTDTTGNAYSTGFADNTYSGATGTTGTTYDNADTDTYNGNTNVHSRFLF